MRFQFWIRVIFSQNCYTGQELHSSYIIESLKNWVEIGWQFFLDFCSFHFLIFRFNAVYNSILFSSPLGLLSNLDLRCFSFPHFFMCPHINSVIRGMPVSKMVKEEIEIFLKQKMVIKFAKHNSAKNFLILHQWYFVSKIVLIYCKKNC